MGAGLSHWAAAEQGNIVQTLIQFSCRSQDKWETVFMDNENTIHKLLCEKGE